MRDERESGSLGVLFVCLGNICRSPTAEGILQALVKERGLDGRVRVDSAGTGDWHLGERADLRMRQAAAARGYELASRARQVVGDELESWNLVVAMDRSNLDDLQRLGGGKGRLVLFSDFLSPDDPIDMPDPYYGGAAGFERVIDLVEAGCPALLDRLLVNP